MSEMTLVNQLSFFIQIDIEILKILILKPMYRFDFKLEKLTYSLQNLSIL